MRRVALATVAHDGLRSALLVVGMASAWTLVTVQIGLGLGFDASSRAIVDHAGGDVWVFARGTRVVDDGEMLGASAGRHARAHPCVRAARPIVVDYTQARRPDRSLVTAQIVAVDAASRARVPWQLVRGDRYELGRASAVAVDLDDAERLGLASEPVGAKLRLRVGELDVRAATRGARPFTQTPYLFMDIATARRLLGLAEGAATYWALDLNSPSCERAVIAHIERDPDLGAAPREEVARRTAAHWVDSSGIGALLSAGSALAAVVAGAILVQSIVTMVRTHARELATVRVLGASRRELAAYVAWQVGVIAAAAGLLALGGATAVASALRSSGLPVVVDARSWLVGALAAVASTAAAALVGAAVLGRIDPRKVLG